MSRGTKRKTLTEVGAVTGAPSDWRQSVPSHLAEPLNKALDAWERNDLGPALQFFGEAWDNVLDIQTEARPILFFGAKAAASGYMAMRARDPYDPRLAEWYHTTVDLLQGAVDIAPQDTVSWHQLGNFYHEALEFDAALPCYRHALLLDPQQTETWGNLGTALYEVGDKTLAWECWDRCLSLPPRIPSSRMAQSYIRLRKGDYKRGWEDYNWRWQDSQFLKDYGRSNDLGLHWDGKRLPKSARLLVIGEQGRGDHVQFGRYAGLLRDSGKTVVAIETRDELVSWFQATYPDIEVVARDSGTLPAYTHWVSLLDLPSYLGTTLETIPPVVAPRVESAPRLSEKLCVGIAYEGAKGNPSDALRSIRAEDLAHLAGLPNVQFVNLQFERNAAMVAESYLGAIDGTKGCQTMLDTGKVIASLDVVLSVDTATLHLAGTLGVKTWALQRFCADWRWMDDRTDCPWYPSVTYYRQTTPGDWKGVLENVRRDLEVMGGA